MLKMLKIKKNDKEKVLKTREMLNMLKMLIKLPGENWPPPPFLFGGGSISPRQFNIFNILTFPLF